MTDTVSIGEALALASMMDHELKMYSNEFGANFVMRSLLLRDPCEPPSKYFRRVEYVCIQCRFPLIGYGEEADNADDCRVSVEAAVLKAPCPKHIPGYATTTTYNGGVNAPQTIHPGTQSVRRVYQPQSYPAVDKSRDEKGGT